MMRAGHLGHALSLSEAERASLEQMLRSGQPTETLASRLECFLGRYVAARDGTDWVRLAEEVLRVS